MLRWLRMVAWMMAMTATVAAGSPLPVGSLVGSRDTTLDGRRPLPHTTVVSGDKLRVDGGLAMVTLGRGNRMVLGRKSEASFLREDGAVTVSLARGGMTIYHPKSGAAFRVKAGGMTVEPVRESGTLAEIVFADGLLAVKAKRGALRVERAGTTKEVTRGSTVTMATTAARAPAPLPSGRRHPKHLLFRSILLNLGLAAGVVGPAVAAIALTRSSPQVSPFTPAT